MKPCLCEHAYWLHITSSDGVPFRGRCVGFHRVGAKDLPGDIDLTAQQVKSLARRGYVVLDCACVMYHTIEIPDPPQLVDPMGRAVHSNGGGG